jgi:ribosomal protein S20
MKHEGEQSMQRKSYVMMVALVAGLALGVIVGPTLQGTIAGAQTPPATPTAQASPFESLRSLFLDKLAAALNIQRGQLDSAIQDAGTGTADEAVTQGLLTEEQADRLKERVQAGDLGPLWGGKGGRSGPRVAGLREAVLNAAATTLNLTPDEVITQLRSGQSVAQLAQARGTTEQAVVDAALAAARTHLDQAVAAGTLTQEQADAAYARLQDKGAALLFHGGRHGGPGRNGFEQPAAPAAPATTPDA